MSQLNPLSAKDIPTVRAPQLPNHIPSLDGMRAASILLVVLAHGIDPREHPFLISTLGHIGNYGVRIFFLISGFLITGLLLKENDRTGTVSLKAFYLRRSIRILPAFYVYVAVVCILSVLGVIYVTGVDIVRALTYTMNYQYERSWYLNHTWSLSVEEQFYLLWPAIILWAKPLRSMKIAAWTLLVVPIIRAIMFFGFHVNDSALTRHFEAVCDALATGCLLAGFYNQLGDNAFYRRLHTSHWILPISLTLLVLSGLTFFIDPAAYYIVGQSIANIGGVLLLDYVVRTPGTLLGRLLNTRPLVLIGVWSYSIYLWQELLLDFNMIDIPPPLNLLSVAIISPLSYYLVEKPFLNLRRRFAKYLDPTVEPKGPQPAEGRL